MIKLHRLNGTTIFLNEHKIELIEMTPDTIITLENGHRYLVLESVEAIVELIRKEQG